MQHFCIEALESVTRYVKERAETEGDAPTFIQVHVGRNQWVADLYWGKGRKAETARGRSNDAPFNAMPLVGGPTGNLFHE